MTTLVGSHGGFDRVARPAKASVARNGTVASFFARWVETYRIRQQERAFEALMDLDPRVRAEIDAAAARASRRF